MGFFQNLLKKFSREKIDWEELEETLISSDIGVRTAMSIMENLHQRRVVDAEEVVAETRRQLKEILAEEPWKLTPLEGRPRVIFVSGVNGTGKTTSTAKLAWNLKRGGASVMLAAADTFRAAAIEQLDHWAGKVNVPIIKGQYKADPSGVCFDALQSATSQGMDYLLIDTAGRLHTRHNLMEELKKMERSLKKRDATAPHDVLLVVDATTGGNALNQAREFNQAIPLTGLIVTKVDGTGKGGIVAAIKRDLGIPTRFVGLGEALGDFEPFDVDEFVDKIL